MHLHYSLDLTKCSLSCHTLSINGLLKPLFTVVANSVLLEALTATSWTALFRVSLKDVESFLLVLSRFVVYDFIDFVVQGHVFGFNLSHLGS